MVDARPFLCVFYSLAFASSALAKPFDYDKHNAQYFASQAEKFFLQQSYEEAAASMEGAIKRDPTNPEYHSRRSDFLYLSQDDDEEALKEIDRAIAMRKPPPPDYYSKKAGILQRLHRCPEALSQSSKVIAAKLAKITSKSSIEERKVLAFFYAQRAGIQSDLKHLQEAENDLSQAVKFDPQSCDIHIHRAKISSELKHWPLVITDASVVIGADHRGSPVLRKREAYLLLASAYAASKNFDKASNTYLTALKECQDDRLVLRDAHKYFDSTGNKKKAAEIKRNLDSLDEDFVPFK